MHAGYEWCMLRITQSSSAGSAKSYYSTSDYYTEGQDLAGEWRGLGAERLGLVGEIRQSDWDALCDNLNPETGKALTPRQKKERRVGYDFNFHVPKSVSLLYALTEDERVLDAFRASVRETMSEIEAEMQTRVRAAGQNEDRRTGNMVWGEFVHLTARPVDGVPDPHLHAHCFVHNVTWDDSEGRYKAGQFAGLKRDAPYFEAVFHSRLARQMEEIGFTTQRRKRGWELAGVPESAIRKFSRRTALIEELARERGIIDAAAKGELGATTRERKSKELSLTELRRDWMARLTPEEFEAITAGGRESSAPEDTAHARQAVEHAISHCFERSAVVPERTLLTEAIKRATGTASPEAVARVLNDQNLVIAEQDGQTLVTTREVLAEERRMIAFARDGRGTCRPLNDGSVRLTRDWLNEGQRRAVRHVLESRDRVTLIRGAAGTGKTTMMKEAIEAIEASGQRVFVFAPSADASRGVLREVEGFLDADTVARLLVDDCLQAKIAGQWIWIDEAGLIGSRTMGRLFELADRLKARIVLSGDRRQHRSVERGAALGLLEEEAGLVPAEIREIQRQEGDYKDAVKALSDGHTEDGFRRLDKLGWIKEVGLADRYKTLAADYVHAILADRSDQAALVIAPTHLEGEWTTDEIRGRLKELGKLGVNERKFEILENANLTEAERADPVNYAPGDVLVFHQNAKGFTKGERLTVGDAPLPLDQASRFQVFRPSVLLIALGDRLRITRNGKTAEGEHALHNGTLCTVAGFTKNGDIRLTTGRVIAKDYGHISHGYVVTSHASQGKTVNRVFIAQSTASHPASSAEQWYVSVSRGRKRATIYTDDKEALLEAVSRSDDRMAATELAAAVRTREASRERDLADTPRQEIERDRELVHDR